MFDPVSLGAFVVQSLAGGALSHVGAEGAKALIEKAKTVLSHSNADQLSVVDAQLETANYSVGTPAWNPQIQTQIRSTAGHVPGAWVPPSHASFAGVDLTGVWAPPNDAASATYIQQYGPYLNMVKPGGQNGPMYSEGVIDVQSAEFVFVGQYLVGVPLHYAGRIERGGELVGMMTRQHPTMGPLSVPVVLIRA